MSYAVELECPEDGEIERTGETVTTDVGESASILGGARTEGVRLPADCRRGGWTSRAARRPTGEADQAGAKRTR